MAVLRHSADSTRPKRSRSVGFEGGASSASCGLDLGLFVADLAPGRLEIASEPFGRPDGLVALADGNLGAGAQSGNRSLVLTDGEGEGVGCGVEQSYVKPSQSKPSVSARSA